MLTGIREQFGGRGRGVLGLFLAIWLNLAIQPCAMAYEAPDEPDCPHCPPAEMQGHHGMHADSDAQMPCADGAADCLIEADVNHDGRNGQLKLKDLPVAMPMIVTDSALSVSQGNASEGPPLYDTIHPGAPPPIHLLNCVFLD